MTDIIKTFFSEIGDATNLEMLEAIRVRYLGKKGLLQEKYQEIKNLSEDERKKFGAVINEEKETIFTKIEEYKNLLEKKELEERINNEVIDITIPARSYFFGSVHPISKAIAEISDIFINKLGFALASGPEIEDDYYNFTALNIAENHPARQMHDSFYMKTSDNDHKKVLRTHTSPVQIRTMLNGKPPFKIIAPGKTYRSDSDSTHTPMFHQMEALYIDKDINMGHLKYTIEVFLKEFFALDEIPLRFRPSFFPFTEPSAEVDIGCKKENGVIHIGKGNDYLEIMGCGMVHQNVLKNVGIDADEYQGFALGMGIERLAMLKYGMPDLRDFFAGDLRWMDHYSFKPYLFR